MFKCYRIGRQVLPDFARFGRTIQLRNLEGGKAMPRVTTRNNEYLSNGVTISPSVPTAGGTVKVIYDGLLAKSGATDVFAHVGFGSKWDKTTDYRMSKTKTGFEASIPVYNADTLNICFKDCANHWDNNSGKNYSFDISL